MPESNKNGNRLLKHDYLAYWAAFIDGEEYAECIIPDKVRVLFEKYWKKIEQEDKDSIHNMVDRLIGKPKQPVEQTGTVTMKHQLGDEEKKLIDDFIRERGGKEGTSKS